MSKDFPSYNTPSQELCEAEIEPLNVVIIFLILGNFADDNLDSLSSYDLKTYDQFLNENDNDLYDWCSKKIKAPKEYRPLITRIMSN